MHSTWPPDVPTHHLSWVTVDTLGSVSVYESRGWFAVHSTWPPDVPTHHLSWVTVPTCGSVSVDSRLAISVFIVVISSSAVCSRFFSDASLAEMPSVPPMTKTSPVVCTLGAVIMILAFGTLPVLSSMSPSFNIVTVSLAGNLITGYQVNGSLGM